MDSDDFWALFDDGMPYLWKIYQFTEQNSPLQVKLLTYKLYYQIEGEEKRKKEFSQLDLFHWTFFIEQMS